MPGGLPEEGGREGVETGQYLAPCVAAPKKEEDSAAVEKQAPHQPVGPRSALWQPACWEEYLTRVHVGHLPNGSHAGSHRKGRAARSATGGAPDPAEAERAGPSWTVPRCSKPGRGRGQGAKSERGVPQRRCARSRGGAVRGRGHEGGPRRADTDNCRPSQRSCRGRVCIGEGEKGCRCTYLC